MRILSALLGIGLLCFTWYFLELTGLLTFCSLVVFAACMEFSSLAKTRGIGRILFAILMFVFFLVFSFHSELIPILLYFSLLFIIGYFVFLSESDLKTRLIQLGWWTVGCLYCGVLPSVVILGIQKFGDPYFLSLLLISFSSDTFAYFGGRYLGRRHFAPLISPKKTIEGSLIGLVAGTMAGSFYLLNFPDADSSLILVVVASFTSSLSSQMGDLFESMIKRYYGIKDSGVFMPGHGGVLDRIDSVLFAGPVIYIWLFFIQIH